MKRILKRLIAAPFVFIAAIIILIEGWLWDDLQRLGAAIGRLPILRQIESLVAGLPPYAALAIFAAPSLLLVPIKLAALYFIAHGQPALGFLTVVAAKVAGTALVARIYTLTEPNLLRIGWFAHLHERFVALKTRVYNTIKSTAFYRVAHRRYLHIRYSLKEFVGKRRSLWMSRWEAARRLIRKWRQPEH